MFSYSSYDVNEALGIGIEHLLHAGVNESSRNGLVLTVVGPVCIAYREPRKRVVLSPTRDANPFFHVMESMWMLAGDNDVEFPKYFNSRIDSYSDDLVTIRGAYGHRWRSWFGYDQIEMIVAELKHDPASRRCVLAMWDGADTGDLLALTADKPCNTHVFFRISNGALNMTVCNRSNDAMWGCFGANAVHFSFLLEYMAMRVGVDVGTYYQFTNNLHVYTDVFSKSKLEQIASECESERAETDEYMIQPGFDADLGIFMSWARGVMAGSAKVDEIPDIQTEFMQRVVVPMFLAWEYRKRKDEYSAYVCLAGIDSTSWRRACTEWVDRRTIK